MSTLDIIAIVLMVIFGLLGAFTGLIKKVGKLGASIAAFAVAFFIASPLNGLLGDTVFFQDTVVGWFGDNVATAGIVSLIVIFIVVYIVVYLLIRKIFKAISELVHKSKFLGFIDKVLGAALGVLNALVIVAIIMMIIGFIGQTNDDIALWLVENLEKSCGITSWLYEFSDWFLDEAILFLDEFTNETLNSLALIKI